MNASLPNFFGSSLGGRGGGEGQSGLGHVPALEPVTVAKIMRSSYNPSSVTPEWTEIYPNPIVQARKRWVSTKT